MVKSSREYFNPKAALNQLARKNDYERYAKAILDLLPVSSGRLLDVGCGLGWVVKEASRRGFNAFGIDPARPFVTLGRKTFKVKLQVASLTSFNPKSKYDVVILNHVLEHIKKPSVFLAKISRLTATHGVILVACPNIASLPAMIFRQRWYGLVPSQHYWQFTPATLVSFVRRSGFTVRQVVVNNLDYQVPGLKGFFFALLLWLAKILRLGDQVIVVASKND